MPGDGRVSLSIIAEGPSDGSRFASLAPVIATNVIEVEPGATRNAAALNPVVDSAPSHWILLVQAGERVGDGLAAEIGSSATTDPRAWGYRIAATRIYRGRPLRLEAREPGDVRLFHRRKARLQPPDNRMKVQGTVVRFRATLDLLLYESRDAHLEALRDSGRSRSGGVRRLTRWMGMVLKYGPRALSSPTREYLWIEAGWGQGA